MCGECRRKTMVNVLHDLASLATRLIALIAGKWRQQGGIQGSEVDQEGSMDATNKQNGALGLTKRPVFIALTYFPLTSLPSAFRSINP